jgi:adenylosuccinate lyase
LSRPAFTAGVIYDNIYIYNLSAARRQINDGGKLIMSRDSYESPFCTRYASREMQYLFSPDKKFRTWRRLWIALAKAEKQLGLNITDEQISQLEAHADDINYDVAEAREKEVRHDVMSHVYAYGVQCPKAKPIIHLGATSCYVGDNTDIIVMREALGLVRGKIINVIALLSDFAVKYRSLPCLAYTHLQPAQLTTVGKRATLWINELVMDLDEIDWRISRLRLLGSKGTTGTQASFMELFDGDEGKVRKLEELIAADVGFEGVVPVSGQTYSRKIDAGVLATLSGIAQSAGKFSNDLRILQNFKEMEEPFEKHQIGSSAMPYKRNPMRSERITSLSRYVMTTALNPALTASTQWFERTLDDSANRRVAIAEAFLGVDAILNIYINVADGLVVYPKVIRQRVMRELPFMATENIMMSAVKKGGDRQDLHERIREHSLAAAKRVKEEGLDNDLLDRIEADPAFMLGRDELDGVLEPGKYTGRAPQQVTEFVDSVVKPILDANRSVLGEKPEVNV